MTLKAKTLMHCFKEGWSNLARNSLMSLASIGTVLVSLLVLGGISLLALNLNHMAEMALQSAEIRVLLKEDVNFDATELVRSWLQRQEGVESYEFISKEESLMRLVGMFGIEEGTFRDGDEEFLPDQFEVRLNSDADPEKIVAGLQSLSSVSEVLYGKEFYSKVRTVSRIAFFGGIIILSLVAFATLIIITNTIRLTVFARRREIEIMSLVGATDWYIRWPYIFEGLLIGLIGSLMAALLLSRGYYFLQRKLASAASFLSLISYDSVQVHLTWTLIGVGAAFGLVGSLISLKRFLKAS
jgi:cell division transport system permease protein